MAFILNKTERRVLNYLKKLKEKKGNPVEIKTPKLIKVLNVSPSSIQKALRVLEASKMIDRDLSDQLNPKVIVN